MADVLTSPSNPRVRRVARLKERRHRDAERAFVVEGSRDLLRAIDAGFELIEAYALAGRDLPIDAQPVAEAAMAKMSRRQSPPDALGVFATSTRRLDDLRLAPRDLVLVAAGTQKPGNLGAMLRVAAAAGCRGVIACDAEVDAFNPNVLRNAAGAAFALPPIAVVAEEARAWLSSAACHVRATVAADDARAFASPPWRLPLPERPMAIVIGPEHEGLDDAWLGVADDLASIPTTAGLGVDSLNASTAAAVVLFDVVARRDQSASSGGAANAGSSAVT